VYNEHIKEGRRYQMDNSVGETTREDECESTGHEFFEGECEHCGELDESFENREGDPAFNGAFNRW
jgi:hypothetical protein